MKPVSSVVRICIPAGAALAALALHTGQAAAQSCPRGGMAMFERDEGISAVTNTGSWLRSDSAGEMVTTMAEVENVPPCVDADFRVSPDGAQLIVWAHDDEILSVTDEGTQSTKLLEGERLWTADVTFFQDNRAVIAALVSRDMEEEPRLRFLVDSWEDKGMFGAPYEVTGADCSSGTLAVATSGEGVVTALCQGSFTQFHFYETSFGVTTYPLDLPDRELVVAKAEPEPTDQVTFFAIVKDLQDKVDPVYELLRIRVSFDGTQQNELVLDDLAYVGGDYGLAVLDDNEAVYMDEAGLTHVWGARYETWSGRVIHPPQPEARLSAQANPDRVLVSEYDVELLTLMIDGWESTTLFSVGTAPAAPPPPKEEDEGGCSAAGTDPATGLAQVLLVMLALALATRLARRRRAAHDVASCSRSLPFDQRPRR